MEINNPHDKFFKETFSVRENVIDFLQGTFPEEIIKKLDLSTLTYDNTSYISEELKEYFSDIVYNCVYRETVIKISILFEHKSYPVPYPHIQVLQYLLKIWETNIKQGESFKVVIPVIVYHGKEAWRSRRLCEYFEGVDEALCRFIPEFEYLYSDLGWYSNEEIKDKVFRSISLRIALLIMRNIFNERELEKKLKDFIEIGRQYFEEEEGLRFLESVIRYLYNAPEIEVEQVIETIKEVSEEGGRLSMTIATKLIEKGRLEGEKKGKIEGERKGEKKGKIEGEKSLLIRLIERKWGQLQPNIKERLDKINTLEELEILGEKVITSESIEELFSHVG